MLTFKYRLHPSKSQRTKLMQTLEICRSVYNETLATRKSIWEQEHKTLSLHDTNKLLPIWKQEHPELKGVYSQVLQNVQERVDLAFKAFFRRVKAGEKPGYPRFRGLGWYDSFTFKQYGFELLGNGLLLSKIGVVKVVLHRPIQGRIKTLTIRRDAIGNWYACFACEVEGEHLSSSDLAVGIDMGLERIANRRKDFAHQLSRAWVDRFGQIAFEKLNGKNMLQDHRLAKSISDAAWNQLIQYTTYKAENAGRVVVLVDPRNTSKQCSGCGTMVEKSLAVRVHACPVCGLVMDRDENAANNILRLGLESLGYALEAPAFRRGE